MAENDDQLNDLQRKLEALIKRQNEFILEVRTIRDEITKLQQNKAKVQPKVVQESKPITESVKADASVQQKITEAIKDQKPEVKSASTDSAEPQLKIQGRKSDFEKFIGENLINKIGIVILIIGVGIGAKYSIDHQLISPLTRIILGYLVGLGLLGFGIKLKKKYENFSAVLVSGSIAVLYFITYAGYAFYNLFPQIFAFVLMVMFTFFTVVAALNYNRQIIAHIGLVGAYAVPFLLSDGSGRVAILFSYISIINCGILILAFKKYWKALYYVSFGLTWLTYGIWFLADFNVSLHFGMALTFLCIFFVTYYVIFLAYKLLKKEMFAPVDIVMLFLNSSLFYGLGCAILSTHSVGDELLGVYTLINAIIHFGVAVLIFKQKLADRNLFYLIIGLVLTFITIAVPVQLDGNWVTLIWACEAALLFWIAKKNDIAVYEKLSYALMILAFISLCQDWLLVSEFAYGYMLPAGSRAPNYNLISALAFAAIFGFIVFLNSKKQENQTAVNALSMVMSYIIPGIFVFVIYNAFSLEITEYWHNLFLQSRIEVPSSDGSYSDQYYNYDVKKLGSLWQMNYSIFFFVILSIVNIKWLKNRFLGWINIGLNAATLLVFLTLGFTLLTGLVNQYLYPTLPEYYSTSSFYIGVRYISYALIIPLLISIYFYLKQNFMQPIQAVFKVIFDFVVLVTIIWILSQELITWLSILNVAGSDKLGLSILWGVYSLILIVLGIWKKKKHFRIGSMVFFGITLIKLFFYDLVHLSTISKTIVFVSLGVLLLIISFLYNKYKHLITDEK